MVKVERQLVIVGARLNLTETVGVQLSWRKLAANS
jgi:hypothetical protein